jgi:metal-responsive CopG/Arc/MetJ family transcriptional regulator
MKTIAISIEQDTLARLDRLARSGPGPENRSKIVRAALEDYLSRAERRAEEDREREILRRNRGRLRRQAMALIREQAKP